MARWNMCKYGDVLLYRLNRNDAPDTRIAYYVFPKWVTFAWDLVRLGFAHAWLSQRVGVLYRVMSLWKFRRTLYMSYVKEQPYKSYSDIHYVATLRYDVARQRTHIITQISLGNRKMSKPHQTHSANRICDTHYQLENDYHVVLQCVWGTRKRYGAIYYWCSPSLSTI